MVRQATRFTVIKGHDEFVRRNPGVKTVVDNSIYFIKMQLHEPTNGSSHLELGNWEEILPEEEREARVQPARSHNDYDEGLFCKKLVPSTDCTSNIRLAKINFSNWPIIVFANFVGK